MRIIIVAAIVASCLAGVALAQERRPPPRVEDGRFRAEWERTSQEFSRYYPQAALEREAPGMATLCCAPRANRMLDCRVAEEFPAGLGFGEATLRTASEFKMSANSYAAYQSDPGNWMQFTMRWVLPGRSGEDIMSRPETAGLCRPPNGNGPTAPVS